jgi:broad specificity phosphatase PhoE
MRLLLIRHGQTPNNVAGALDTARPGAGLTALGQAQAGAIPLALAGEEIAGVYASPLVRTQLTAAPLAGTLGLDVRVTEGLEEIAAGGFEMRTDEESVRAYIETVASWAGGEVDRPMPGGGDGRAFFERYDAAIRAIAEAHRPDATVAAVSHGAAIRLWAATRGANVDTLEAIQRRLMNTGLAALEGDPDRGWELVRWQAEPLGGLDLQDLIAHDVTGDPEDEAVEEAR